MQKALKVAIVLSVLAVLIALAGTWAAFRRSSTAGSESTTLQRISQSKTFRVGYVNFPPCVYRDLGSGEMKGHFVSAVEEIAKQMGARCEFQEATWATFTAGLQNRQFDLSIAPTFGTVPRAMSVAFSRPLMYVGSSAIVNKGEKRFSSLADIDGEGVTVAVTQGEAGHEYAQANFKKAKVSVQSQGDQSLAFSAVLAGRADIGLGDAYAVAQFAAAHPEAEDLFAKNPYNLTAVCWAVRPSDTEFLNFINTAIDVLDSTGKLAEFEHRVDAHWLHVGRTWVSR